MNIILYAIPVFFLLIAIELLLEKVRNTRFYRVNDAITSLSTGVLSRMIGLVKSLVPFTIYILIYENLAIFTLPNLAWVWIMAFIAYDLCYYWNHRFGHEVSVFWASHVVHHSSEDYNLSTALRQSSGGFLSFIFYFPLAIIGVSPAMLISIAALNLIYQFWVHTQHVPKLGVIEWLFVTPSNHRVHHAQNSIYLDRNYGGVFIIWDRIFGSFQQELDDQPPVYGVRKALKSWNPLWANFHVYTQLAKDSYRSARWQDKVKVWFGRTGWRPQDVTDRYPLERVDLSTFARYDTQLSGLTKLYCILQYTLTAALGVSLMIYATSMSTISQIAIAVGVVYSCVSLGILMENRRLAIFSEWCKHLLFVAVVYFAGVTHVLAYLLLVGAILSMVLLSRVRVDDALQLVEPADT